MWILNTKRQQVPNAASKRGGCPCTLHGIEWNCVLSKIKKPDLRVFRGEKDFLRRWHLDSLPASATATVFTTIFYIPIFSLQLSQFEFENILSSPLVLSSWDEGEACDFPSRYILKGLKGPTTSSRNFNKHIEIASWLILGISLLPAHFIEDPVVRKYKAFNTLTTARIIASYGRAFSHCLFLGVGNLPPPSHGCPSHLHPSLTGENFKIDCTNEGVWNWDITWKSISVIKLSMHTECVGTFKEPGY